MGGDITVNSARPRVDLYQPAAKNCGRSKGSALWAYLFGLRRSLVTHSNATVAPDTPMPQIGARTPRTTRDTAQYVRSHARCILRPGVVGRTVHKSLSDKIVLVRQRWVILHGA
jgi:hypothetical protein